MGKLLAIVCTIAMAIPAFGAASSKATLNQRLDSSATILKEIMQAPDKGIPQGVLQQATCVAVIPGVLKAALGFGGQYGQGVVTCKGPKGWSAPLFIRLAGGSWGLQIGGKSTDVVLIAVNQKGMQDLLKSKVKLGAGASAAAGPVGRTAAAGTNLKLQSELLTYSRSKGLFAGVDLNGSTINRNNDDNNAYYGHDYTNHQILEGHVKVPAGARNFVNTVAHYFHKAKAS